MTDEKTITDEPPEDICGGPVDQDGGQCAWCGAKHDLRKSNMMPLYPLTCDKPWPDRPRRSVHPRFGTVHVMYVECWQCHEPTQFDSVNHPMALRAMQNRNAVLHGKCNACGAGIDVMHAKIMRPTLAAPLVPGGPIIRG